jgi:stage III sporulation protein AB
MFKIAGFLCIMAGCIGWGNAQVREEKSRVYHLRELIRIIRRIQDEIRYGKHTLPEICLILSQFRDSWYSAYFQKIYEQLAQKNSTGLETVWAAQMELCFRGVPLQEEEKDVLKNLPNQLGLQEETIQASNIGQSLDMLSRKCKQAEENYESKTKVIRSVSILTGFLLMLLLL